VDDAPLPASVTELVHEGATYYLVGTAHVSQRSVDEVKAVIDRVKPDVVCVELDQARHDALTKDSAFRDLDVFKVVREGKTLYLLAHLALASYQRRIGASLGVRPGAELLAAVRAARERGLPVELIDRDINITLKRTWKNLGLWKRSVLLSSLLVGWDDDGKGDPITEESVEDLKEPKALSEMLTELSRAIPQVKGPLIDERDRYLASKTVDAGRGKQRVVAVVGAAHVPGMKAHFGEPVDRAELDKLPPPSLLWRAVKWLIPILFLAAIVWGWQRSDTTSFTEMMLAWILPTSIGAGAHAAGRRLGAVGAVGAARRADRGDPPAARDRHGGRRRRGVAAAAERLRLRAPARRHPDHARLLAQPGDPHPLDRRGVGPRDGGRVLGRRGLGRVAPLIGRAGGPTSSTNGQVTQASQAPFPAGHHSCGDPPPGPCSYDLTPSK
jgi:pheromone shutdown-related protein TraB